jgi:GTP pyrophosphokinase
MVEKDPRTLGSSHFMQNLHLLTGDPMTSSPILTSRFTTAFDFARTIHAGQVRKGGVVPYLSHPMAVSSLALSFGADEDEAIAALLHDTAEDGGGEPILLRIRESWGYHVEGIVRGCSDSLTEDPTRKAPWRERKEAYLAHFRTADRSTRLVAASDKLHNLQCTVADLRLLGPKAWERFNAGPSDQLWYYSGCVEVLASDAADPWADPLQDALAAFRLFATDPFEAH